MSFSLDPAYDELDEFDAARQAAKPIRVIWQPLPGSQELALCCPCNLILFEGTRGPGKTDSQLMAFRKNVGQGYGRFWRGVIFDREYKNLDDLVVKGNRWFREFGDGARFLVSAKDYKWVWPTGEELLFRSISKETEYWNYHGHEYPFVAWNELSKYPTSKLFDMMMSVNRSSFLPFEHSPGLTEEEKIWLRDWGYKAEIPEHIKVKLLPEIPLVVFATTNPYGPGHNWIKAEFIDVAEPGQVIRKVTNVFNPRTQQREDIVKTQVRIFGSYKENRYLSPVYVAELEGITEENRRRAWLWGDWDIVAGGALDDVWKREIHIKPRFRIPESWHIDRSLDWGSTHPASVGWWAEANGEEAELEDGSKWCPPRGSLIRIFEWYLTKKIGSNEGLKMGGAELAKGILEREKMLLEQRWIFKKPLPGPADNQIRSVIEATTSTIEKIMADWGVSWTESDKSPGSRKVGLQLLRDRLEAATRHAKGIFDIIPQAPPPVTDMWSFAHMTTLPLIERLLPKKTNDAGIYFLDVCKAAIATLPVLPRDEVKQDDVDTEAEDHVYDDVRYRCLAGNNRMATDIPSSQPT